VKVRITDPLDDSPARDIDEETGQDAAAQDVAGQAVAAPPAAATDEELARLQRDRDALYDRLLRTTAEFDNYRKRVDRERREQSEFATADLMRSLLPLVDNIERALAVEAPPGAEAYRKGVEIIHTQMLDLLRRHGVTPIQAVGAQFDPHVHEAAIYEESPGREEGLVIEELQRGYRLGDRLLRPAMVKVAKA
jgi:molecular chaperone GrpE